MSLTNLSSIIEQIQTQPSWLERQGFLRVLEHWKQVVGDSVAQQTYPTGIYRHTLQVAVSSSVWSQALSFQRHMILAKLRNLLGDSYGCGSRRFELITDIHFSTAKWEKKHSKKEIGEISQKSKVSKLLEDHPSYIPPSLVVEFRKTKQLPLPPQDPVEAFQRWKTIVKNHTVHLPKCPRCHAATPQGELKRWGRCGICAMKC